MINLFSKDIKKSISLISCPILRCSLVSKSAEVMEKDDYQLAKVFVLSVYFDESVSDLVSYSLALMLSLLCPWACLRHKKLR